ncbi:MAG: YicC family protein [Archangiaceae bacterium]|nr:YicC family protein [Archangiaceae bacterium]
MPQSMTGFGSGHAAEGGEDISVELKSVNHKFCEVKARLPRELASLEAAVVKQIKARLSRGAVDLTVKRASKSTTGTVPVVDTALVKEYRRAFKELAHAAGLSDDVRLRDLMQQPGVLRLEEPAVDHAAAAAAVESAISQALDALAKMRGQEGAAIEADLLSRLSEVETRVLKLKLLAPQAASEHHQRLVERVAEIARGLTVDPQRLAQEVALFAERTDVAEELTRLSSHIIQFKTLLSGKEPAGRQLDFLVQEMHREVNTTGSKSQHPEISNQVVALKAELERIREQVQNVE